MTKPRHFVVGSGYCVDLGGLHRSRLRHTGVTVWVRFSEVGLLRLREQATVPCAFSTSTLGPPFFETLNPSFGEAIHTYYQ